VAHTAPDAWDDPDEPIWARRSPLELRPWRDQDLDQYHALLDDPGLWRYMVEYMPTPFTKAVAADLIAISNAGSHHEVRAILAPRSPAGQVRMLWSGPELLPDEAEVSYWLGRSFRGRGLASEAVRHLVVNAFKSRPGLRRVVAYVHPDNRASVRVLERAGFSPSTARLSDGWLGFARSRTPV
jgi:RimJ/RimL family protein N-acetyltransferase